jgi:purine-nucleoside phosphorylase
MKAALDLLAGKLGGLAPRYGIVLGSGLGSLVSQLTDPVRIAYRDLPGFPVSAVSGHAGEVVAGRLGDVPVIMLSGRVHFYEKGDASAMRLPIEVLKGLGVEALILTNSAGSLREDLAPGSVMQIVDHIN